MDSRLNAILLDLPAQIRLEIKAALRRNNQEEPCPTCIEIIGLLSSGDVSEIVEHLRNIEDYLSNVSNDIDTTIHEDIPLLIHSSISDIRDKINEVEGLVTLSKEMRRREEALSQMCISLDIELTKITDLLLELIEYISTKKKIELRRESNKKVEKLTGKLLELTKNLEKIHEYKKHN